MPIYTRAGKLRVRNGETLLDQGISPWTLLARCSDPSPLSAATSFVHNRDLDEPDDVVVTGSDGKIGTVNVFCMTAIAGASVPAIARTLRVTSAEVPSCQQATSQAIEPAAAAEPEVEENPLPKTNPMKTTATKPAKKSKSTSKDFVAKGAAAKRVKPAQRKDQ